MDKFVPLEVMATISLSQDEEFKDVPKEPKKRNMSLPSLYFEVSWGYFDVAAQGKPSK